MQSTKTKSPEFHELQRLRHLSGYVENRIDAGAYDDSLDKDKAVLYLNDLRSKIEKLEGGAA